MALIEGDAREKVKSLLKELFQFDAQDLDFGIYRIMNFKRSEIERFIDHDLIAAAEAQFKEYARADVGDLQREVDTLKAEIERDFGEGTIDGDGEARKNEEAPKVRAYIKKKEELKARGVTQDQISNVFNNIFEFFSRYYDKGDFLSKRRFGGKDKYSVPYNGEEVMLHWANRDQYYIKSWEYFRNYSFIAGSYQVSFILKEAEAELNNIKGESKYFVLNEREVFELQEQDRELKIFFNWRALTDEEKTKYGTKNTQAAIASDIVSRLFSGMSDKEPVPELRKKTKEDRTILEKHLVDYVNKNTTDYFIHKNLKAFLNQELDFYIKNEIMDLDEIEHTDEGNQRINQAKIRAIKAIGRRIIEFLAQIEEFQRILFEKKKLVLRADYCITLDKVPEAFYNEIGKNEKQVNEWKELFKLDETTKNSLDRCDATEGRIILNSDFLKKHKNLVLDTKFFDQSLKNRLLECYNDIDEATTGILIKSENFQALNLLLPSFKGRIDCIYIDPPYNTGSTKILYKNEYEHSSWICLMEDRLLLGLKLLRPGGILEVAIDDYEGHRLRMLIDSIIGEDSRLGTICVVHNPGGRHDDKFIATAHEYMLVYSNEKSRATTYNLPLSQEDIASFKYTDEKGAYRFREFRRSGSHSTRLDRPNMWYPIFYNPKTKEIEIMKKKEGMIEILPIDPRGIERVWRWGKDTLQKKKHELVIQSSNGGYIVKVKTRLEEKGGLKPKSVWNEPNYSAALGTTLLKDILGREGLFSYPKSLELVVNALRVGADDDATILDYFAGSGTTAHAVLKLNAEDEGSRKYILVEMEDYFETVLLPRIKKIMYSENWKEGVPLSKKGYSHILKYMYLEQYEDTLNNIVFRSLDKTFQETLDTFRDYFLRYMLEYETRESPTRLVMSNFKTPFSYKIKTVSGNHYEEVTVDLVETFNYLLGLNVEKLQTLNDEGRTYLVIFGKHGQEKTIIVWRDASDLDLEKDRNFIEERVLAGGNYDRIFVNGDSYVKNAQAIEPQFRKMMGV